MSGFRRKCRYLVPFFNIFFEKNRFLLSVYSIEFLKYSRKRIEHHKISPLSIITQKAVKESFFRVFTEGGRPINCNVSCRSLRAMSSAVWCRVGIVILFVIGCS